MNINYHPNRNNLQVGQQVILNTNDEYDGQTVTITNIKSYGFEIAEDGEIVDKHLFEFSEINGWEMSRKDIEASVLLFEETESKPRLLLGEPWQPPKWWSDPVTQRQLDYLKSLGYNGPAPKTKGEASDLIDQNTPSCHYCGGKATGFGFFDEPVCKECGG